MASNTHTQNIESYCNRMKIRMNGVHFTMLELYLDEFMWRERHGKSVLTTLVYISLPVHQHVLSSVALIARVLRVAIFARKV